MTEEILLTLHCPQCRELTDVVTEGNGLVCLDCGWQFDEKVAAKFLAQHPHDNFAAPRGREVRAPVCGVLG
jgi:hypothetical protein